MAEPRLEPVFPVGFDEDALTEDLERLPASAENALREFRKELRRRAASRSPGSRFAMTKAKTARCSVVA